MTALTNVFQDLSTLALTKSTTKLVSLMASGTLIQSSLLNLYAIDQTSWCPAFTSVTIDPTPALTNQKYEFGSLSPVTSYSFSDFTITSPICPDSAGFTYTAKQVSGAALPTFIVFDPLTKTFSWSGVTLANVGTYNIMVTGVAGNR